MIFVANDDIDTCLLHCFFNVFTYLKKDNLPLYCFPKYKHTYRLPLLSACTHTQLHICNGFLQEEKPFIYHGGRTAALITSVLVQHSGT